MVEERVFIAGAGPVGFSAAARLLAAGVPVTMFEAGADLNTESRASTFHPSTLDMLTEIGSSAPLVEQGLKAPKLQYRFGGEGKIAGFDFGDIADLTDHPYRVQCEQWRLTRVLHEKLKDHPNFEIVFSSPVTGASQDGDGVRVTLESDGRTTERKARWLIGADGASSIVRRSLEIEFEGFTWPERFLVTSTPFDFLAEIPDLDPVSYVADPECWHFLLKIPGLWRVMFPVGATLSDEEALDPAYGESLLRRVVPGVTGYEVVHRTLYRVHQRVAKTFRLGRVFLAGDAAHINNPLGGMGMNGGIHDALNLTSKLLRVRDGEDAALFDAYTRERQPIAVEYVQAQAERNRQLLRERDEAVRMAGFRDLQATAADPARARKFLLRSSMIDSLQKAEAAS